MRKFSKTISLILVFSLILNVILPSLANVVLAGESGQLGVTEEISATSGSVSKDGTVVVSGANETLTSAAAITPAREIGGSGPISIDIISNKNNIQPGEAFEVTYSINTKSLGVKNMSAIFEFPYQIEIQNTPESNDTYEVSQKTIDGKTIYKVIFSGNVQPNSKFDFVFGLKFNQDSRNEFVPIAKATGNTTNGVVNVEKIGGAVAPLVSAAKGSGNFTISNVDTIGTPIVGAVFEIRKQEQVIETVTTGVGGNVVTQNILEPGKYTIIQKAAPSGFIIASDQVVFEIFGGEDDKELVLIGNQEIGAQESRGVSSLSREVREGIGNKGLDITKYGTDSEGVTRPIAGAVFELLSASSGVFVKNYISDEAGKVLINDLPPGQYSVVEKTAPYGYARHAKVIAFIVEPGGMYLSPNSYINPMVKRGIEVVVQDSKNEKFKLDGAEFDVYKDGVKLEKQKLLTENGGKDITAGEIYGKGRQNLLPGNYTIMQTKAATNYILDPTPKSITITNDDKKYKTITVRNDQATGDLIVKKSNISGTGLRGVKFEIIDSTDSVVETIITGANGVAVSTKELDGIYKLKEIKAPEGYDLDLKPIPFQTDGGKPLHLNVYNDKGIGTLEITKTDEAGNVLRGATFKVKNANGVLQGAYTTDVNGKISVNGFPEQTYVFQETGAPLGYAINKTVYSFPATVGGTNILKVNVTDKKVDNDIAIIVKDEAGYPLEGATFEVLLGRTIVETIISSVDGIAMTSPNLGNGTYTIRQIVAPESYKIQSTIPSVTINDSSVPPQIVNVVNTRADGDLVVLKIDRKGNPLSGAEFDLRRGATIIKHLKISPSGFAVVKTLDAGKYTLVETKPATGHSLLESPIAFEIKAGETEGKIVRVVNANDIRVVEVMKTDETGTILLQGAKFEVRDSSGIPLNTFTTDVNGKIQITGLPDGNYSLHEVEAPYGYEINEEVYAFPLESSGTIAYHHVKDTRVTHGVEITKTDSRDATIFLSGAVFEILKAGVLVDTIKTGTNGKAFSSKNLEPGSYTAVEKTAPTDYLLDTTPHPFTVSVADTSPVKLSITNVRDSGGIKIIKYNELGEYRLKGAEFEIRNSADAIVEDDLITGDNGEVATTVRLSPGTYKVKEVTAPANFDLSDDTTQEVVIDGTEVSAKEVSFYNQQHEGDLIVTKIDDEGKPLKGVVFEVHRVRAGLIETITTGPNGVAVCFLPLVPGSYELREIIPPVGFAPIAPTIFEMGGKPLNINVTNANGIKDVKVTKISAAGTPLENAVFEARNTSNVLVRKYTTDATGVFMVTGLDNGTYKIVETEPPIGYILDSTEQTFNISSTGTKTLNYVFKNYKTTSGIKVIKEDEAGYRLEGATFEVRDLSNDLIETIRTNKDGIAITAIKLDAGVYTITETVAPVGYIADRTPKIVVIAKTETSPKEVTFVNKAGARDLTIKKTNEAGEPMRGVSFKVRDVDLASSTAITTGLNGEAYIVDLAPGNYTLTETVTPAGYNPIAPVTFVVETTPVKLEVSNTKAGIGDANSALVTKKDQLGNPVAGAKFEVRNSSGGFVREYITGATGTFTVSGLTSGTYKLVETLAPTGYIMDKTEQVFAIRGAGTNTLNLNAKNTKITNGIMVTKEDEAGYRLEGATFEVKNSSGNLIETIRTDKDGIAITAIKLDAGVYTITETVAPVGYIADRTPKTVVIAKTETALKEVTFVNKAGARDLTIKKTNEAGEPMRGVSFKVRDVDLASSTAITTGVNGEAYIVDLAPGKYTLTETVTPAGYNPIAPVTFVVETTPVKLEVSNTKAGIGDANSVLVTKKDQLGNPVAGAKFEVRNSSGGFVREYITGTTGTFTISGLTSGTYKLVETLAPTGYIMDKTEQVFAIRGTGTNTLNLNAKNTKLTNGIMVTKEDESGYRLRGATFEVKDSSGNSVETIRTDKDGIAITAIKLEAGTYTITETVAPEGYIAESTPKTVVIDGMETALKEVTFVNKKILSDLTVKKTDEAGSAMKGVLFEVRNTAGGRSHIITTGGNGEAYIQTLAAGRYTLREIATPAGYNPIAPIRFNKVDGAPAKFAVTNTKAGIGDSRSVSVTKTDQNGEPVAGAKFEVRNSDGGIVRRYTTDANGTFTISSIANGTYRLVETSAPVGYIMDTTERVFVIKETGTRPLNLDIKNAKITDGIMVTKEDEAGYKLAGATFTITDKAGNIVDTIVSNEDGVAVNNVKLGAETYTLTEKAAPVGYVISTAPETFVIDGTETAPKSFTFVNKKGARDLTVIKTDEAGVPMKGVLFEVIDVALASSTAITTGANGEALIVSLPAGNYTLKETSTPAGYNPIAPITFTKVDGTPVKFAVTNTKAGVGDSRSVLVTKTDQNGNLVAGAKFEVRNFGGKVVRRYTTGTNGTFTISSIASGTYRLVETLAPVGYIMDTTEQVFVIKTTGTKPLRLSVKNIKVNDGIMVIKEDEQGYKLAGATFEVTDTYGNVIGSVLTTDENGVAITDVKLALGTYNVTETIAPEGYIAEPTPRAVIIDGTETVPREVTFVNKKIPSDLTVKKTDEAGSAMKGVSFEVRNTAGGRSHIITTGGNGEAYIQTLAAGRYTLREIATPAGYNPIAPIRFNKVDGAPVKFAVTNTKAGIGDSRSVSVTKTDQNGEPVAGAKFEVRNSGGGLVRRYTTDANGTFTISSIANGTYRLVETSAPVGYIKDTTEQVFVIKATGTRPLNLDVKNTKITDGIMVTKEDEAGYKLAGATFTITDTAGNIVDTILSNEDGVAVNNEKLDTGTYTLTEKAAPVGYVISTAPETFVIDGTETAPKSFTFVNKKGARDLTVIKTDEAGVPMKGVLFEVIDVALASSTAITTGANGEALIVSLPAGNYTLKETATPAGYNPIVPITFTKADGIPVKFAVTNTKAGIGDSRSVLVTKIDQNGAPVAGAKFEVRNFGGKVVRRYTTGTNGTFTISSIASGTYRIVETLAPTGYIMDTTEQVFVIKTSGTKTLSLNVNNTKIANGIMVIKEDEQGYKLAGAIFEVTNMEGNVINTIVSNEYGVAVTDVELIPGTYTVKEIVAPQNYVSSSAIETAVIEGTETEPKVFTFVNKQDTGNLTVIKKDDAGNVMKGVSFDIVDSVGDTVETITTGPNGVAISKNITDSGTYKLTETVPSGYVPVEPITFVIDGTTSVKLSVTNVSSSSSGNNEVLVTKKDQNGNLVKDAKFEVRENDNVLKRGYTTDENGTFTITGLSNGTYKLVETLAPKGYLADKTEHVFVIKSTGNKTLKLDVKNTRIINGIIVNKVDVDGYKLAGAVFAVKDAGGEIETIVSDENGVAATTETLEAGKYTVTELTPPDNYDIALDRVQEVIIEENQKAPKEITFVNPQAIGNVTVTKVDQNGMPIKGVEFNIKKIGIGGAVEKVKTGSNGVAVSKDTTGIGTYELEEIVAPEGFEKIEKIRFEIKYAGGTLVPVKLKVSNSPNRNKDVTLTDRDQYGNVVVGAEFEVMKADGTLVKSYTTNAGGMFTVYNLPDGTYKIVEKKAPNGYVKDSTEHIFKITSAGSGKLVLGANDTKIVGGIKVVKVDVDAYPLEGAYFEIRKGETLLETVVSDGNGEAISTKANTAGTYVVREIVPPENYGMADVDVKDVTLTGSEIEPKRVTFVNPQAKGNVVITKLNEAEMPMKGVKFEILSSSGIVVDGRITTGTNGVAVSEVDKAGTYTLREVEAPDGYRQMAPIRFEVKSTSIGMVPVKINVSNNKGARAIDVIKNDQIGSIVPNAKFKVFDVKDNEVRSFVTEADGKYKITGLRNGTYKLIETDAPSGYILDSAIHVFTIDERSLTTVPLHIENTKVNNGIEIVVTDQDGNFVKDSTFEVRNSIGFLIDNVTSDENGEALVSREMRRGTYKIDQIGADSKHMQDNSIPDYIYDGSGIDIVPVMNIRINGDVQITKLGRNGEPLRGAKFEIRTDNAAQSLVDSFESGVTGLAESIDTLSPGNYILRETVVPAGGYTEIEDVKFTLLPGETPGEVIQKEFKVYNVANLGSIEVYKFFDSKTDRDGDGDIDVDDLVDLENAGFKIFDNNRVQVGRSEYFTSSNGIFVEAETTLGAGTYILRETAAPYPYRPEDKEFIFHMTAGGTQNLKINVENRRLQRGIIMDNRIKPDPLTSRNDTHDPADGFGYYIDGTVYEVIGTRNDGVPVVPFTISTGFNGKAISRELKPGTYIVKQKQISKNFKEDMTTEFTFIITAVQTEPEVKRQISAQAEGELTVYYVDSDVDSSDVNRPLAGKFKLIDLSNGADAHPFSTGQNGIAIIDEPHLRQGINYKIVTTESYPGYYSANTPIVSYKEVAEARVEALKIATKKDRLTIK